MEVLSAALGPDATTVRLQTSRLRQDTPYALTVSNVRDRARSVHTLAPNTCKAFRYTGLYAWWKLAEGQGDVARDYSGNGHHGTLKLGQGYHSGRYFQGLLRDVQIHRQALPAAEIQKRATANATNLILPVPPQESTRNAPK